MQTMLTESIYEQYLAALLAGERTRCIAIVQDLVTANVEIKDLYVNLFQRALYQVGELWEHQAISVAVEHLATAITESLIPLVQSQIFSGPRLNRSIIVACVADEYHQLGARMVADLFEFQGWRGYFLGANTPVNDLLQLIADRKPDLVGLSLSVCSNMSALLQTIDTVQNAYPDLPLLVGGQAFRWGGQDLIKQFSAVSYVASLEDLERIATDYAEHCT